MKKFNSQLLASIVLQKRQELKLTQAQLSNKTNINRATISRIEANDFIHSLDQLDSLANVLEFDQTQLFEERTNELNKSSKIAVAGTGSVGFITSSSFSTT